jgi:hypothetical protein
MPGQACLAHLIGLALAGACLTPSPCVTISKLVSLAYVTILAVHVHETLPTYVILGPRHKLRID